MTKRTEAVKIVVDRSLGLYEAVSIFAAQPTVGVVDVYKGDDSHVMTWRYSYDSQDFEEIYDYIESNG